MEIFVRRRRGFRVLGRPMARGFSSPHFLFSCLKDYPFKLRQNVQSDSAVSIMRVPGRVDRYIGTTTSCNKGIGLVLRPLHMLAGGLLGTGTEYGYVTIPRFAVLNGRSISAAPTKWTREVSSSRAKRLVLMYAKHLTGSNEGAAHDDIVQCLQKGLPIDLYKTNRKVRHALRNGSCHIRTLHPRMHVISMALRARG